MNHHSHDSSSYTTLSRRFRFLYWILGLGAVIWVLLRSGLNPKRVSYPCQQAAMPLATTWLISVVAFLMGRFALRRWTKISGSALAIAGILWFVVTTPQHSGAAGRSNPILPYWEVENPVSRIFVLDSIPPTSGSLAAGDASVPDAYLSDPAIDSLFLISSSQGTWLHKTVDHPDGIVGSDNVVIIKGNFQWYGRVTTNTDRIKGLIWQILRHPNGFTGEIIVCDNTQGTAIDGNDNNSEDPAQSILSVVSTFHAKGYPVYLLDWKYIFDVTGSEYSEGDYRDAYMYDPVSMVSYPKFHSPSGEFMISLRYGLWDSVTTTYDLSRLCLIDFAVLKHHGMAGATVALKNWIGVMTTAYSADRYGSWNAMHYTYLFSSYALVARIMDVTFPRLSIVDAAWTSYAGNTTPDNVLNTKILLASTDPVAASWYAAKYVLTPIADPIETEPDLPGSKYHNSITNWWRFLHDSAGRECTMDSASISVYGRKDIHSISLPTVPSLCDPAQGAIDQPTSITMRWYHAQGATGYRFQLATDSLFSTKMVDDSTLTDTTRLVESLSNATKYYWRVSSKNDTATSSFSTIRNFMTIQTAPPVPTLLSPLEGATNLGTALNFTWSESIFASSYHLQLSDDSLFSTFVVDDSTITTTQHVVSGLFQWTTYFWRVRASNGYGSSEFTHRRVFSTGGLTSVAVELHHGWNLVALPVHPADSSLSVVYPSSISSAYAYGAGGYVAQTVLSAGRGFWVKFPADDLSILSGTPIGGDTIHVVEGWNLVGSMSTEVAVADVKLDPPDMVISAFYGYTHGYYTVVTMTPGLAYWVKTNRSGSIIFPSTR